MPAETLNSLKYNQARSCGAGPLQLPGRADTLPWAQLASGPAPSPAEVGGRREEAPEEGKPGAARPSLAPVCVKGAGKACGAGVLRTGQNVPTGGETVSSPTTTR